MFSNPQKKLKKLKRKQRELDLEVRMLETLIQPTPLNLDPIRKNKYDPNLSQIPQELPNGILFPDGTFVLPDGTNLYAHSGNECIRGGFPCTIHRPTDHHLMGRKLSHSGIVFYRTCMHGVAVIDPDEQHSSMLIPCPQCDKDNYRPSIEELEDARTAMLEVLRDLNELPS